jgi:hypothetical protein
MPSSSEEKLLSRLTKAVEVSSETALGSALVVSVIFKITIQNVWDIINVS